MTQTEHHENIPQLSLVHDPDHHSAIYLGELPFRVVYPDEAIPDSRPDTEKVWVYEMDDPTPWMGWMPIDEPYWHLAKGCTEAKEV